MFVRAARDICIMSDFPEVELGVGVYLFPGYLEVEVTLFYLCVSFVLRGVLSGNGYRFFRFGGKVFCVELTEEEMGIKLSPKKMGVKFFLWEHSVVLFFGGVKGTGG